MKVPQHEDPLAPTALWITPSWVLRYIQLRVLNGRETGVTVQSQPLFNHLHTPAYDPTTNTRALRTDRMDDG
jgi:hypothetical protein